MRKTLRTLVLPTLLLVMPGMVAAQLALPQLPQLPQLPSVDAGQAIGSIADLSRIGALTGRELGRALAVARIDRLAGFVRANRASIEMDGSGNPAVRGELVATGMTAQGIAGAQAAGFRLIEAQAIEGLDIAYVRFAAPPGTRLGEARRRLENVAGSGEVSANQIYFPSGAASSPAPALALRENSGVAGAALGLIDGGIAAHPSLSGPIDQRGFSPGAPSPSAHGTAVASLIAGRDPVGSAAPGAPLLVADVYGTAPAGGNALAIARALGWLAARRVPVVTISLVGPDNPLLRSAVRAAQAKGVLIVAAVGNDGPAAPPAYPASWPGVLAVTGTDQRGRALPEAGRVLHVDFAAPGSAFKVAAPSGGTVTVRGTSFAAPLVAGRLARLYPRTDLAGIRPAVSALADEAEDIGPRGHDRTYGHGLICRSCVRR